MTSATTITAVGPPKGTWASRRKDVGPLPPLPALTSISTDQQTLFALLSIKNPMDTWGLLLQATG